jgi:broad specificity phosphatase PhoE
MAETRTIMLIRHGATKLNNDDVSVDRIRGWKDIPLSKDGEEEAHHLGEKIKNLSDKPDVIVSSDLKRAADTASIISEITGIPLVEETKNFRPWNVGEYAGSVTKDAVPVLAKFATEKPDEKLPGGESFDDFARRFFGGVSKVLSQHKGKVAIVTHHRGERLMKAWIKNGCPPDGEIDKTEFCKKGEPTGAIMDLKIPMNALEDVDV